MNYDEMTSEELGKLFPIELKEYTPTWEEQYKQEARKILMTIGDSNVVRVNHIGSTAVKGLAAKPIIDILVEIEPDIDLEQLISRMEHTGYLVSRQQNIPAPNLVFYKGYTDQGYQGQAYHVYVRYPGDWDELYFRDYLQEKPSIAQRYAALKKKLADTFRNNRDEYTEAKTAFIQGVNKMAKAEMGEKYDIKNKGEDQ